MNKLYTEKQTERCLIGDPHALLQSESTMFLIFPLMQYMCVCVVGADDQADDVDG